MDWDYVRTWGLVLSLAALVVSLLWGLGYAIYLNRIGSKGWASTRRLLGSSLLVFAVALLTIVVFNERGALWILARGRFGSAEGQYLTGILYQEGGSFLRMDHAKSVNAFRCAANQGHAPAKFAMARACYFGLGTAKDESAALMWAQAAAHAGHPFAMVLAGELLHETSPAESKSYFSQAFPLLQTRTEHGDGEACFTLGSLYSRGLGVPQDLEEALFWMLLAQHLGITPVQAYATQMFERSLSSDQQAKTRARVQLWIQTHR